MDRRESQKVELAVCCQQLYLADKECIQNIPPIFFFAWVIGWTQVEQGPQMIGPPVVQVQDAVGFIDVLSYRGGICNHGLQMIDEDV